MEFATGHPVIIELDGGVEHVDLLGDSPDRADLLLIAPCTANTISKIAFGIDDTPVTTMATVAMGSGIPVLIAPAMHLAMFENPFVKENIDRLERLGSGSSVRVEGKKAKIADNDEIVDQVIRPWRRPLRGEEGPGHRRFIGGAHRRHAGRHQPRHRGDRGRAGPGRFFEGAEVELWMGRCQCPCPHPDRTFRTVGDLLAIVDGGS